ncbi:hypothetical protein ABZ790_28630 [Saccharopolyspora shandongensis]
MKAVRTAENPEQTLLDFLQTTYEATADSGGLGPPGPRRPPRTPCSLSATQATRTGFTAPESDLEARKRRLCCPVNKTAQPPVSVCFQSAAGRDAFWVGAAGGAR